jgi:hypothetical protein
MKTSTLLILIPSVLLSFFVAFGAYKMTSDASLDPADLHAIKVAPLDSFPVSDSFIVGRFPGVVDAKQSEPVVAAVTGYYTFFPEAFGSELEAGTELGAFQQESIALCIQRDFLKSKYEQMQERVVAMGDLEKTRKLEMLDDQLAEMRETVKILEAIEANPKLESTLLDTAAFGGKTVVGDLDSSRLTLRFLEAEATLLANQDTNLSIEHQTFEFESSIEEMDVKIKALTSTMPFDGLFTPAVPNEVLGRSILIQAGSVIGMASDTSEIFLGIISTDPELAILNTSELGARVEVGHKWVEGVFIEKSLVSVKDRSVPLYRFQFPIDSVDMDDLIGSQVSCELVQNCSQQIATLTKLKIVQMALEQHMVPVDDWRMMVEALYPDATYFAETKSSVIVKM